MGTVASKICRFKLPQPLFGGVGFNGWRYVVVIFYGFETINFIEMENLKALVYKGDLTPYQRALARREFEGLIERLELFEKAVKNNAILPNVIKSVCDNCTGDFFVTTINGGKKCDKCGKPLKQTGL